MTRFVLVMPEHADLLAVYDTEEAAKQALEAVCAVVPLPETEVSIVEIDEEGRPV